jgi:type VI secretion system protein ImpM
MAAASCGFFGKIPARGDFVRAGLPNGFVAAWDGWLQSVIPVSRELLGEDWVPAWLEAPIWRFSLEGGICGTDPVLGIWMPSVDRAGRHFPLTLAAVVPGSAEGLAEHGGEWLAAAEQAGLDAVTADALPERLAAALSAAPSPNSLSGGEDDGQVVGTGSMSRWWTDGAPRVAPRTLEIPGLPDGIAFAGMLDDRIGGAPG